MVLIFFFLSLLVITCPSQTYQNANWSTTQTGQTANGTCVANYAGSPTRQCILNGTTGSWNTNVTNPCVGKIYFNRPYALQLIVVLLLF